MSFILGHVLLANLTPHFGFLECSELDSGCVPWGSSGSQVPAVRGWRPWHLLAAARLLPSLFSTHTGSQWSFSPSKPGKVPSLSPSLVTVVTHSGQPSPSPSPILLLVKTMGEGAGSQVTHAW